MKRYVDNVNEMGKKREKGGEEEEEEEEVSRECWRWKVKGVEIE